MRRSQSDSTVSPPSHLAPPSLKQHSGFYIRRFRWNLRPHHSGAASDRLESSVLAARAMLTTESTVSTEISQRVTHTTAYRPHGCLRAKLDIVQSDTDDASVFKCQQNVELHHGTKVANCMANHCEPALGSTAACTTTCCRRDARSSWHIHQVQRGQHHAPTHPLWNRNRLDRRLVDIQHA